MNNNKLLNTLNNLNSTNVRIFATLVFVGAVVGRYVASSNWEPSKNVLTFLAVMAGVDVAQHAIKRFTNK